MTKPEMFLQKGNDRNSFRDTPKVAPRYSESVSTDPERLKKTHTRTVSVIRSYALFSFPDLILGKMNFSLCRGNFWRPKKGVLFGVHCICHRGILEILWVQFV